MPTLNQSEDGRYYIRGKDFPNLEQKEDDYWTWQVLDVDATINTIRRAGCDVTLFPVSFDWRVEQILWWNGYIATKGQIAERWTIFMDRHWNVSVRELAAELDMKPHRVLNEAARRGLKVGGINDKMPRHFAARIREYFEIVNRSH